MIPLRDDNPTRTVPVITYLLIAVNTLVWLLQATGGTFQTPNGMMGWLAGYTMVPLEITQGIDIPVNGVTIHPMWLTLLTSMFMHGGLLHLGGNMLYLYIFGNNIEDALGKAKYLTFYLICGTIAGISQILWNPDSPVPNLGASGAIAGILGAYLVLYPTARVDSLLTLGIIMRVAVPAYIILGLWIVTQFFSTFLGSTMGNNGGVAYLAHIGGFLAGMILIRLFGPDVANRPPTVEYRTYPDNLRR